MRRNNRDVPPAKPNATGDTAMAVANGNGNDQASEKKNGHSVLTAESSSADLGAILASLQTMRDGDFSTRR